MLRELKPTRQVRGDLRRKWYRSKACDLIIWFDDGDAIAGFQFCYDKDDREHALSWMTRQGFSHMRVDSGEGRFNYKGAPVLLANGAYDPLRIIEIFDRESENLPPEFSGFVSAKLRALAGQRES